MNFKKLVADVIAWHDSGFVINVTNAHHGLRPRT
jgi:hypothetical protein